MTKRDRPDHRRPAVRGHGKRLGATRAESDQVWEAFLVHLATMSARAASRMPGMPSQPAFAKKRQRDRAFDDRAARIMATRKLAKTGIRPDVWARFFEQLPGSTVDRLCAQPGMPSMAAVYQNRRRDPDFRARLDAVIHDALRTRRSNQARALRMAAMRREPAFLARMDAALQAWRAQRRSSKPRPAPSGPSPAEVMTAALRRDTLYAACEAAVPARLPPDLRADVVSDLVLAVLEGVAAVADLPRLAPGYVRAWRRMFSPWGQVSLDAPVADGSRERLVDRLEADADLRWA